MVASGGNRSIMANTLLGDYFLKLDSFSNLTQFLNQFQNDNFKCLSARQRFKTVNEALIKLIQDTPPPCFLLGKVIEYIHGINQLKILDETYHFTQFEFWLNHYAEITPEDNFLIRAKIVGQYVPREDYQMFFPIGMGKCFSGTHYVAAHLSPDVDTTIASFWGWVDAFAARVSTGLHLWSLPGGPPDSPIITLFKDIFHPSIFSRLARQAGTLTLNATDLVTQKNMIKETGSISMSSLDHGFHEKAVILVDENEHYIGDWRSTDVEPVRQVIILFNACLRWFETNTHVQLISLFAKEHLNAKEIPILFSSLFDGQLKDCEPINEFSDQQRHYLDNFLSKVLNVPKGLRGTFGDLSTGLEIFSLNGMKKFQEALIALSSSDIFNSNGELLEERPKIFHHIQKIIHQLDNATHDIRNYIERLDIGIKIKTDVLGKTLHYLTRRNVVEEIRLKMENYDYLTVAIPEKNQALYPVGIVWAKDLRKPILGTVSFRDFCNPEEVKMASYLSVISVVDHHKTNLKTNSPPMAIIGDAQSCNVLMAEQTMELNDRYSLAGMSQEAIAFQIDHANAAKDSLSTRLLQRLLLRQSAIENQGPYFIHPKREFVEYLFFLYAILDDTDLLSKVSNRDVKCVVHLLNRLKSLSLGREVEVIHLNDIPKDQTFAMESAKKILQNEDMYSLYRKIYELKERQVSANILSFSENHPSNLFADTKIQNGCCRIGQLKVFSSNVDELQKNRLTLIDGWVTHAKEVYQSSNEVDLHILMISTIPNAEEVYSGKAGTYAHQDELWFWIPPTEQAQDHLTTFLSAFQNTPELHHNPLTLQVYGSESESLISIFQRSFIPLSIQCKEESSHSLAILRFRAGSINSRKSMISPYLPRLIP